MKRIRCLLFFVFSILCTSLLISNEGSLDSKTYLKPDEVAIFDDMILIKTGSRPLLATSIHLDEVGLYAYDIDLISLERRGFWQCPACERWYRDSQQHCTNHRCPRQGR